MRLCRNTVCRMKQPKKSDRVIGMIPSVKIGGHVQDILFPHAFEERSDALATTTDVQNKIRLRDTDTGGGRMAPSKIIAHLIHEIEHNIDDLSGHAVFEDCDGKSLEGALNSHAEIWFQFLCDNGRKFCKMLDDNGLLK